MGKKFENGLDDGGGGGEGRRKMLLLAIAGGSIAVIAGAALIRRWWIKTSAKFDPTVDSADAIPLDLPPYETMDIIVYAADEITDGDVEFVEFDGLTSTFPSLFVPDEIIKSLFKNLGRNTSEFSTEISAVCVFQPIQNKNQICSDNDDRLNRTFIYNNGAVVIEELQSEDEELVVSERGQSNLEDGRLSSKNTRAIIHGNAITECVLSQITIVHIPAVINSCLSQIAPHCIVDSVIVELAHSYKVKLHLKTKPSESATTEGQKSPDLTIVVVAQNADEESKEKAQNESQYLLQATAEPGSQIGAQTEVSDNMVKYETERKSNEEPVAKLKEADNKLVEIKKATDESAAESVMVAKKRNEEVKKNKKVGQPEPCQLASGPLKLLNISVGAETEMKGNMISPTTTEDLQLQDQGMAAEKRKPNPEEKTLINKNKKEKKKEKMKKSKMNGATVILQALQQAVAQPGRGHVSAPNWPVHEKKNEKPTQLPSDPNKILENNLKLDSVGVETETNAHMRSVINKKKKEKKKEKKKRNKPIQMLAVSDQAPKVKGGLTVNPYQAEVIREKSFLGVKGMINLGQTCFMNSILQCLTHCQPLLAIIATLDHSKCDSGTFCYICGIKKLLNDIHSAEETALSPEEFKKDLTAVLWDFRAGDEADAYDYLCGVVGRLGGLAHDLFFGHMTTKFNCCRCGAASLGSSFPFMELGVDVHSESLTQALHSISVPTVLEDYKLDNCSCSGPVQKLDSILKLPEILVFHVRRFTQTESWSTLKLNHHVAYPAELNMAPYMSCSTSVRTTYKLTGIVEHIGHTGESGHYVSVIRHNSRWFLCNDSQVKEISESEAPTRSAYLLVYTRSS